MPRPSKLSREQWLELEHRHTVDGVAITRLAAEYGLDESSIRRKIKPTLVERARGVATLRDLAVEKVEADRAVSAIEGKIAELPETRQIIVYDLAARMKSISVHLTCAAETSAATARKLALLANAQAERIDITKAITDKTRDTVSAISAITRTANEAGAIGMGLIAAHRAGLPGIADNTGGADDVSELTDEQLDEELRAYGIEPPQG